MFELIEKLSLEFAKVEPEIFDESESSETCLNKIEVECERLTNELIEADYFEQIIKSEEYASLVDSLKSETSKEFVTIQDFDWQMGPIFWFWLTLN